MPLGRCCLSLVLLASLAALAPPRAAAQDLPFKVIVHSANPASELKREYVATLFLNRRVRWSFGIEAVAVDQSLASPIREAFSRVVLGQPIQAVQQHWSRRMLKDREFPPPVKASDAEVIEAVAKEKGGIGYVAQGTALPDTVKVLRIVD